jgi:DNA-binding NtrC family response regulator
MTRVLVVDDHLPSAEALAEALSDSGYTTATAGDGRAALTLLGNEMPDVIVTDLRMDGLDGIGLIREVHALDPDLPVILVTAFASIDRAVEATRAGAYSFLTKPIRFSELEIQVRNAAEMRRLQVAARQVGTPESDPIVGTSSALRAALARADRAATSEANVLVTGETGTGKELLARRIHQHSPRAKGPLVAVNAGAIPPTLVEAELFGHAKGSFTGATSDRPGLFEAADGGTLFLDEVAELSSSAQTGLLRAIEERTIRRVGETRDRPVDVRIIAATHKDLSNGSDFRRDLYFRLNVIPIELPPLRARGGDVLLLFGHALRQACRRAGRELPTLDPSALQRLLDYSWPGNIRELMNMAERVAVLVPGDRVSTHDLPMEGPVQNPSSELPGIPDGDFDLVAWMESVEEKVLRRALDRYDGVKARAAASLGLERNAFRYKLRKYGIPD